MKRKSSIAGHWSILSRKEKSILTGYAINKQWNGYWGYKKICLYKHCENRTVKDMSDKKQKSWWMGIEGIEMIWHGEWSDPKLTYRGIRKNYWEIENTVYQECKEDFGPENAEDDNFFKIYCQKHAEDIKTLFTGYE